MPRVSGVYQLPPGSYGSPDTTVKSAPYNTVLDDIANTLNTPTPVAVGGTGATNPADARTALGADNADNLTSGTVADARLPGTQAGKVFTTNTIIRAGLYIDLDGDRSVYFRNAAGTTQGMIYNSLSDGSINVDIYDAAGVFAKRLRMPRTGPMTWGGDTVWTSGNDGSGSGLDAGLLEGQAASFYTNIPARLGYTPLNAASYTAADVLAKLLTVDGSGSALDADFLRGFAPSASATGSTVAMRDSFGNVHGAGIISNQGTSIGRFYFGGDLVHYLGFSGTGFELGPSGPLYVGGDITSNGILQAAGRMYVGGGSSFMETNGNISFSGSFATTYGSNLGIALDARIKNDGATYGISISGNAATATSSGSATTAGSAATAGNASNLGGVAAANFAQFSYSSTRDELNFPLGQPLIAYVGGVAQDRRALVNLYLRSTGEYGIVSGTQLGGSWRACGLCTSAFDYEMFQRVS